MDALDDITLSINTLLAALAVPFVYYCYAARYWFRPDLVRRAGGMIGAFSMIAAVLIILKMGRDHAFTDKETLKLTIAHLAPLILTLLILKQTRPVAAASSKRASKVNGEQSELYQPQPVNMAVERLSWDDLIINDALKSQMISIISLLKDPKTAKNYGIEVPKGILLSGPPGTGKTTVAKVIANTANLSFFNLRMDEVASKWVGESEKNLSALFRAAQKHSPAVIFIDEVDAIGRSRNGAAGHQWSENLLNHLLQLVDGVVKAEGLYIIAATNRPDLVDAALKRAGRLNRNIDIPLPDFQARIKLFHLYLSRLSLSQQVDLRWLAEITNNKSCADIKEICNQAGLNAFTRESGNKNRQYLVTSEDLTEALNKLI